MLFSIETCPVVLSNEMKHESEQIRLVVKLQKWAGQIGT